MVEEQESFSIAAQQKREDVKAERDLDAAGDPENSDVSAAQTQSAPESKHSRYFWWYLKGTRASGPWSPGSGLSMSSTCFPFASLCYYQPRCTPP